MARSNNWMGADKRRPRWGLYIAALLVFVLLYIAHDTFLRRTETPVRTSITSVGVAVEKVYNTLDDGFRGKVSLAEFAGMYHLMATPDLAGELPDVRQAGVTDAAGPEVPVARFRVEYPDSKAKAEYHFSRIEGIWQLQSFTRIPSELDAPLKGIGPAPQPREPETGRGGPPRKAAASPLPLAAGEHPATPCDYIIQPGDTLSALSQRFYGTTRHWRRILEANPGLTERSLRIGRRIRIPSNPEPPPPSEEQPGAEPKAALTTTP